MQKICPKIFILYLYTSWWVRMGVGDLPGYSTIPMVGWYWLTKHDHALILSSHHSGKWVRGASPKWILIQGLGVYMNNQKAKGGECAHGAVLPRVLIWPLRIRYTIYPRERLHLPLEVDTQVHQPSELRKHEKGAYVWHQGSVEIAFWRWDDKKGCGCTHFPFIRRGKVADKTEQDHPPWYVMS